MNPVFPSELRNYFLRHDPKEDEQQLTDFFAQYPSVRETFLEWAECHKQTIESTPRLYNALDLSCGYDLSMERTLITAANITCNIYHMITNPVGSSRNIYHKLTYQDRELELINKILDNPKVAVVYKIPGNHALNENLDDMNKASAKRRNMLWIDPDLFINRVSELYEIGIFNDDQLVTLFSIRDHHNQSPLHEHALKSSVFEKLEFNNLMKLMTSVSDINTTPLFQVDNLNNFIPLLEKKGFNEIYAFIFPSTKKNLLQNSEIAKTLLPLLSRLKYKERAKILIPFFKKSLDFNCKNINPYIDLFNLLNKKDQIKTLFSIKATQTPIHNNSGLNFYMPLLGKMNQDQLVKILSIKDFRGDTPLHIQGNLEILVPILSKLTEDQFITLVFLINDEKKSVIEKILPLLPILEAMSPEGRTILFSKTMANGDTVLHTHFMNLYPLLNGLSNETLNHLFSIQNNQKNTLLHLPQIWKFLHKQPQDDAKRELLGKLNPEIFSIKNSLGFTAREYATSKPSEKWLVGDKYNIASKKIEASEYPKKAQSLKSDVETMWKSFVFGKNEGNIPEEHLNIGEQQNPTPEDVGLKLEVMLNKIINKEVWIGTPKRENPDEVHAFYSQMLTNFEEILDLLKSKDPAEQAATLISIAKTEFENRCAAAYQAEIEQAKMVLDTNNETLGLDTSFNKIVKNCLIECIEKLIQKNHDSDSHVFSQMLFSTGLALSPDPLSKVTTEQCQQAIKNVWNKDYILPRLKDAFNVLNKENLHQWFYEKTPADFYPEKVELHALVKEKEHLIMKNIKEALKEKQLNEVLIDKALNFFQSSVGGALRLTLPQRKHLSDTVFKIFSEACSLQDIELAELHFKKEGEVDRLKRQELQKIVEQAKANGQVVPPEVIQQQKGLTDKLMRVNPEFMVTKAYFQARLKMATELKVDSQKLELILAAKKEFDHLISNLSDDYEIDFNASESGLPSLALANTRKFEYANQFVKMPEGINYPGTHFILTQLGVIS